jgi:regulator of protease activity HflC (stomatin/prohibitin superfamily)
MKRIKLNAYQAALVFKNGAYQRMLNEGTHWLWFSETVEVFEKTKPFAIAYELNILLQDKELANALHVIEVGENEIVLLYENALLTKVLTAGRYAFWKGVINYEFIKADTSKLEITETISKATLANKLLAPYTRVSTVENYEKAVLFVDGKYTQTLDSGAYTWWKNNIAMLITKVDMRTQQLEINGQEILTKDKAAIRMNAQAQYKVMDIEKAILKNKEFEKQLYVTIQFALRQYTGNFTLDEMLDKKESMSAYIIEAIKTSLETLGVMVISFGIRDIILPGDVKEIMNQVLIAEKKAQANTIMRREETASTRSLLNTAKLMEDNPVLYKLKEMEYVEKIADKISSISVNGNGVLIDQLKQIFVPQK